MVKNLPVMQETRVWFLGKEDSLEEGMETHSSILPGEFHGQRSLAGYSPWDHKESDTIEWLTHKYDHFNEGCQIQQIKIQPYYISEKKKNFFLA